MAMVEIDSYDYWFERGSYVHLRVKETTDEFAITKTLHHVEGGLEPQEWHMNIICPDRTSLFQLESSYRKTGTDRVLTFIDRYGSSHQVYFSEMDAVENLDLGATIFRVPIILTEVVVY